MPFSVNNTFTPLLASASTLSSTSLLSSSLASASNSGDFILSVDLTCVFSISIPVSSTAILAFSTRFGIFLCALALSMTSPWMNFVSFMLPPRWWMILENINIIHQRGGSIKDTKFIHGLVIDKARAHKNMPKRVENARIAVLDTGIEIEKTQVKSTLKIKSPELLAEARLEESKLVEERVEALARSGVNVLFTEKGIDDHGMHFLAKKGILAVRRCNDQEIKKIVKATGARVVSKVDGVGPEDIGKAAIVEERGVGNYKMIYVEGCENPKAVSILIYSGAEHVADEVERALDDALHVVGVVIEDGKIVAGGGAPEIEMATRLRKYATTYGGREQLAIMAYADALEEIPKGIAENAGLDAIDIIVDLRNKHNKGQKTAGLNVFSGKSENMLEIGVIEPLRVKTQEIKSATDAAVMILRINDILMAKETGMMDVKPEHTANFYDGIQAPDCLLYTSPSP